MLSRPRRRPDQLRSSRFFAPDDLRSFGHRSRQKQSGFATEEFSGRPVVAILNTGNDLISCHAHFRQRVDDIRRGIWQAGGFPVEVPVLGLSETFMKPTSMFYRNLLAMETEEVLRAHPVDAAVLMGGCDKTVPALLMGALSADVPSIVMPGGPMNRSRWRGRTLGSGSDVWRCWADRQAGRLSCADWSDLEDHIAPSAGHCMTMGTASTMTSLAEAMGMCLPGAASIPAVHAAHARMAAATGRQAVELAWHDVRPSQILTEAAFDNAIAVLMALGGSTNAIVHLLALAGRAGVPLPLEKFDAVSHDIPVLANLQPAGTYVMEDFFEAGGLPGLMARIRDRLHTDAVTVAGQSLGQAVAEAPVYDEDVIRLPDSPVARHSLAVLRGNLCPDGAIIKTAAASDHLLQHTGPAIVFSDYADLKKRLDDPRTQITPDHVMVLQNAGPVGGPGFPEWGMLPLPKSLLEQGIRDLVRISDARMSGTSFGTCVLHVAPEAAVGGPLALVRDGDRICLDVPARRLDVQVDEAELTRRRHAWQPPPKRFSRGYGRLLETEITQACDGCDFRFLEADGSVTPDPDIF